MDASRDSLDGPGFVVALGKFDAMHLGHRSLAEAAADMGHPFLISFWGMAQVLGWEERRPIVAPVDRPRVLRQWANHCRGLVPHQRFLPFDKVRSMSPREFVELLAYDLGATGVVVGSNYRFGHRAKGTAADLVELGTEMGMRVRIADLLTEHRADGPVTKLPVVSSSRVRKHLSKGDMDAVAALLGRRHRLVATITTSPAVATAADPGHSDGLRAMGTSMPDTDSQSVTLRRRFPRSAGAARAEAEAPTHVRLWPFPAPRMLLMSPAQIAGHAIRFPLDALLNEPPGRAGTYRAGVTLCGEGEENGTVGCVLGDVEVEVGDGQLVIPLNDSGVDWEAVEKLLQGGARLNVDL
ncbi:unnamed protein product [Pedinophyceae sp. YPF-701]|nr:unnamed protein product [Pedinophyceae sp. YPF-701]